VSYLRSSHALVPRYGLLLPRRATGSAPAPGGASTSQRRRGDQGEKVRDKAQDRHAESPSGTLFKFVASPEKLPEIDPPTMVFLPGVNRNRGS